MPMSNLLVKTLSGARGGTSKFVLQLDRAVLTLIREFQIIPPKQFGRSDAATGDAGSIHCVPWATTTPFHAAVETVAAF